MSNFLIKKIKYNGLNQFPTYSTYFYFVNEYDDNLTEEEKAQINLLKIKNKEKLKIQNVNILNDILENY